MIHEPPAPQVGHPTPDAQRVLRATAAVLVLLGASHANADSTQARCDIYPKGEDRASAVLPCTFSQRQGQVSIERADGVRHELSPKGDRPGNYVDEKGRPAYRQSGLGKRGLIFRLTDQSVYVYWETAGLPGARPAPRASAPPVPFEKTLTLQGVSFRVTCPNNSSANMLGIVPSGLEIDNSPISREIDGQVAGAEVADLNADGSPEIYVYVTSAGSGSYGSLVAYSANRRKSLSQIDLPPVVSNGSTWKGYMGHDEFAVVENVLTRRFPVYRPGDTNAKPTGGVRQLQYKLVPGEAGWLLKLDRKVDF